MQEKNDKSIQNNEEKNAKNIETKAKNQQKRIFGLKIYEFILLVCDVISVLTVFIFFEKSWLSFSCSFIGCFAILFLAKGYFFAPAVNVIYDVLYIILSYSTKYFGDAIVYIIVTLPIDVYASFSWKSSKEKDTEIIIINKLSKKEWTIFGVTSGIVTIAMYFILRSIGTDELILETISFITTAMAGYLLIRKNNAYSLVYSFNSATCIVLWTMNIIKGDMSNLPMVVNFIFNFMIESYGFINLQRELKRQSANSNVSQTNIEIPAEN